MLSKQHTCHGKLLHQLGRSLRARLNIRLHLSCSIRHWCPPQLHLLTAHSSDTAGSCAPPAHPVPWSAGEFSWVMGTALAWHESTVKSLMIGLLSLADILRIISEATDRFVVDLGVCSEHCAGE